MVQLSGGILTPLEVKYQLENWNQNRSAVVIGATSTIFTAAFVSVLLRLAVRWKQRLRLQCDDYLIVVALVLAAGLLAEAVLAARFGAGIHSLKAGIPTMVKNLQILFALQVTYNLAHLIIKTSILMLYKRMFTFNSKPFKYAWYTVFAYVVGCSIMAVVVITTECKPIRYSWEQPLGVSGKCVDLRAAEIGPGVALTVADVMILMLPMPTLWSLQISRMQKIQLCTLFGIGSLAVTASIVRIVCIARVSTSVDFTYDEVSTLVWSILEVDLGIICACASNLRPLFKKRRDKSSSSPSGASKPLTDGPLATSSHLQWLRTKLASFYGSLADAYGSSRERLVSRYFHSKYRFGNSSSATANTTTKTESLSRVRIIDSENQELEGFEMKA